MSTTATIGPNNSAQPQYQSFLVTAAGGFVYYGVPGNNLILAGNQSGASVSTTQSVSMAFLNLAVYMVDGGTTIKQLNTATLAMVAYAATAGSAPTDCNLCCNWRGRLVLAGDVNNPQNFYMARVGTPTDWDYSQTDPAAAVAGNLSASGQIGEPITCLIPYTDDYMIIGCAHSIWMLEGDPADGGTIVRISDKMGIVGPNAWCIDPQGLLYFVASGGLYSVRPIWEFYQPPQCLSEKSYNQFFQNLSWSAQYISMAVDVDLHYIYVFVTPSDDVTDGVHLVLDTRNGGLWPFQYPLSQGPTATALCLNTASANDRLVLIGGWDGYIRQMSETAQDDDGSTIFPSLTFGPFKPDPEAAILTGVTIDFGEVLARDAGNDPEVFTNQALIGVVDGINTVFTVALKPMVGTLQIYANGMRQDSASGIYVWNGNVTITFTTAPVVGTILTYDLTWLPTSSPTRWAATVQVSSGPDAYSVTEGTPHSQNVVPCVLERRQKTFRQRLRGGWFSLTLTNPQPDTYFSFETAQLEFIQAGRNRERR